MFKSNEEYFDAVRVLANRFHHKGEKRSGDLILEGLGLLNGLTDGWHLFLERLEEVRSSLENDSDLKDDLDEVISIARGAVFRR